MEKVFIYNHVAKRCVFIVNKVKINIYYIICIVTAASTIQV